MTPQLYSQAVDAVAGFFEAAGRPDEPPSGDAAAAVRDVAAALSRAFREGGEDLIARAVGSYAPGISYPVPHSVNVAVLSQPVGRELELQDAELERLCLEALVHDVGSVRIPDEVLHKRDSLSEEEWELVRERPVHSWRILRSLGEGYEEVAEVAHQVHERADGSGYPRGLKGDDVLRDARILGAVDVFEAIIHPRPYKKTVPAAAMYGLDNLMRMSAQFGDRVLKALVSGLGLFPVGTYVKLSSGEVARVCRTRKGNPMRPVVEVLYDGQDRPLQGAKSVDLMQSPHLYVFRPLTYEDLRQLGLDTP